MANEKASILAAQEVEDAEYLKYKITDDFIKDGSFIKIVSFQND